MREAISCGAYYERDKDLLREQISAHYFGPRGPGALPKNELKQILGIISPNSPYNHCGDCMAWNYRLITETPIPDVYIIISANHIDQEEGLSTQVFMTPLGFIPSDVELAKAIAKKGTIGIEETPHDNDHGIEVQLPFLQHAKYNDAEKIKILAIIISENTNLKKLSEDIKKSLQEQNKKAIIIASTDLTRYGPLFHYVPFTTSIQSRIYELDDEMLEFVKRRDVDGYSKFIDTTFDKKSGLRTIELLLRMIDPCAVRVLRQYTSGDITGDYKNSVSYAAVIFDKLD